jgi:hypothetical protein
MTDAALPVTPRAVERFVEDYLTSLGAEIEKSGCQWSVTLPSNVDSDLELDGAVLELVENPDDVSEGALAIAPGSPFVERVLDEAADQTPTGSLSLTVDQLEIRTPPWLTASSVDVVDRTFTPYYDRRAVCALFHVGIETVSEYQREELHAVAIDLNEHEERSRLAETYLELTAGDNLELNEGKAADEQVLVDALDAARASLRRELEPSVQETRKRATRAAEVELDEYRQFIRQRCDELADETDRLTARIEEVTERIDTASNQEERVEALRTRKELQAERDELSAELNDLTSKIEAGFPEKRRKIRDRHAITVRMRPVIATAVSYERGDLELVLQSDEAELTRSYAYAVGAGVMEEVTCDRCGHKLTADNPLTFDGNRTIGTSCCGE